MSSKVLIFLFLAKNKFELILENKESSWERIDLKILVGLKCQQGIYLKPRLRIAVIESRKFSSWLINP